jgi:hypothetical protein
LDVGEDSLQGGIVRPRYTASYTGREPELVLGSWVGEEGGSDYVFSGVGVEERGPRKKFKVD